MTGWDNDQARDGRCNSIQCQAGWMIFEVTPFKFYSHILFYQFSIIKQVPKLDYVIPFPFQFAMLLAYTLIASTLVGDLLINMRSVYKQDKAISIGFWMMWIAIFAYGIGRVLYELISRYTCQHWGNQKIICHLHHDQKFGDYVCYLTILFLSLSLPLKVAVWFFCKDLQLYKEDESKGQRDDAAQDTTQTAAIELEELMPADNSKYFFYRKTRNVG